MAEMAESREHQESGGKTGNLRQKTEKMLQHHASPCWALQQHRFISRSALHADTSLAAASFYRQEHGAKSKNLLDFIREYKGVSWSTGADEALETVETLPNILKIFNPLLHGFSKGQGSSSVWVPVLCELCFLAGVTISWLILSYLH